MTLEAGTPIGKYVVKRKLAEGGMAEIYLATSTGAEGFEKEVVIKRVRSFLSDDESFVQMFIAEARLASGLNHANVVQIFDFAKHEDSYYLAMEYVRGCSLWDLRKRCREKGISMPPVLVAHIGAQVAAGLHYAHRLKSSDGELVHLVHRDVTPHNVLLSYDGAVKLTDFGIAKASNKLTQPGVLKGKFAYMSPEQSRGEEVDARTDVFALGVVLWEMLTGGKLFDGDSEMAVLRAVQESVIARPARLNPDVPEELDRVVCTALERDPEARYQSAGELERALAQCVLRSANSVDETDVGTFVRRLFDVPLTQFIAVPSALMDRSQRSRSGSVPVAGTAPGAPARSRTGEAPSVQVAEPAAQVSSPAREPTAVLPGSNPASGRDRPVRPDASEEALVSASTQVLSRDPLPPRSTQPLPPAEGTRNSRPMPVVGPAEQGSAPRPAALESVPAPVREAQVMPPGTSAQEASGPKRGSKGLWIGASAVAVVLIGGVAALVAPSKPPAASAPATSSVQDTASPAPKAEVPPPPAPEPVLAAAPDAGSPDAGALAAATPPPEPPPAQTGSAEQTPAEQAPVVEAKGTLSVKAVPYADVYVDGKLVRRELQGTANIPLVAGPHKVTFKHPSRTESFDITLAPNGRVTKAFNATRK
ncbi:serine/threonine-protein kinase [Archangium sp. Cb G35]|uniref:serine/threonine protein kinase n=1 Tax=Archangium sp. Cb G35 TaxID=1920190 RepID=UPI0009367300|nr:serine/threonine-protein kinase [Archangium sp. Cb G35]